jgi:hypothetical protein
MSRGRVMTMGDASVAFAGSGGFRERRRFPKAPPARIL